MSEMIVLDTLIWLWLINANFERFLSSWRDHFELADRIGVSPVSCFEIALAQKRGRISLESTAEEWFEKALSLANIELLPLTGKIAASAVELSPIHKDPFDRLIIATALEYGAKFASKDRQFTRYPELSNCLLIE